MRYKGNGFGLDFSTSFLLNSTFVLKKGQLFQGSKIDVLVHFSIRLNVVKVGAIRILRHHQILLLQGKWRTHVFYGVVIFLERDFNVDNGIGLDFSTSFLLNSTFVLKNGPFVSRFQN
jgi:hypothetical protein